MATFDERSIFGKREDSKTKESNTIETKDTIEETVEPVEETTVTISIPEPGPKGDSIRLVGEDLVESERARKERLKKEKKEKKLQEKEYQTMVKAHKKALKENPENIKRYESDPDQGLSNDIVERRVLDELVNVTKKGSTKSKKAIVFSNIFTFFNILTFLIAIWLISVKAFTDLVFLVIVSANLIIGIYQEIRAKKTIDRLSLLSAPTATVVREGEKQEVGVGDVVLDDIICLKNGDQICADSILIDGSVEVNESLLTGESDAIIKKPGDLLFSGSFVVSGSCRARVDKVGKDNYIEKLTSQAKKYRKPNSELLKSLKLIIYFMAFFIIPIGIILFVSQYFINDMEYVTAVRKTAGAMIGMIPSGLWLLTSVALFVGVVKLSQRNVLVQELYCIEMLARINVLCLDKTGTITDGTMNVKNVIDYNSLYGLTTKNIISAMLNALNDDNLTSKALEDKFGRNKRIKFSATIPFSSQRKYNAVSFDKMGTFALGAPEFVLKRSFEQIKKEVNKYAALGYRVLSLAHFNGTIENGELPEENPEIVSLILIEDNIRPDAINTINYFKESGVSVRVISGDNPITVAKISERAGIENADQYISLDGLSDAEVEKAALKYTVFGRVTPSQKKLLVTTLKKAGNKVAMTGDGVNDILALREADCSIAIASGSEAARNVSHLVLLDSNFDSMPKVVSEGRRVINNVSSVASLFLTKTIFSLLLAIQAMIRGAYPISTNQLIMIDMFAIGIPSFFLVLEPNNKEVEGNFLLRIIKNALPGALTILVISLIIFWLEDSLNLDTISTQTIIVIAATHTCLMVLFKVSKPLNSMRRLLCIFCYTAFIVITFVLPQFLEFRPIFGFAEYYSEDINQEVLTYIPQVEISSDYYYVFDGKVTEYQKVSSEKNINVSCVNVNGKYYYAINDTNINEEVIIPDMSFTSTSDIVLGGTEMFYITEDANGIQYKVGISYSEGYEKLFSLDKNGYLWYTVSDNYKEEVMITLKETDENYNFYNKYGGTKTLDVQVCLMPKWSITNDIITISPVTASIDSNQIVDKTYKITPSEKYEVTLNPYTMELLVNGKTLAPILDNGQISPNTYKVETPTISVKNNNHLVYNGLNTGVSTETFGIENIIVDGSVTDVSGIKIVPYDASYYLVGQNESTVLNGINSNVRLSNPAICPDISTTVSGNYIINGYYTEYKSISNALNPRVDSNYNLVLGDVVTDFYISPSTVISTKGGIVTPLSIQAKVFLLMLCSIAAPLMKLLQTTIPWIKKQIEMVQKLLSKI